jgi:hypothetical protein
MRITDLIIEMHNVARDIEDPEESLRVRLMADELAKIGNRLQEKNFELCDSGWKNKLLEKRV